MEKKLRPTVDQWARVAEEWEDWTPMLTRRLAAWRSLPNARRAAKGRFAGDAFDHHVCFAPWFSLFVDADGSTYPCCTGRRKIPDYGNVNTTPIQDVLTSLPRREVLAGMASGHEFDICRSCDEFLEENLAFARAVTREEKQ